MKENLSVVEVMELWHLKDYVYIA